MGDFLHKYNTDNVHTRAIIVGLINLLNSKIQYENVLSDTVVETIGVPFFPNMGGDERFLQDFFTHWEDCQHPRMADGNYDVIPRGVVTLTGNTINTTAMTHRFVRGTYVKEVNGELQKFNSFLNSIPLTMSFDLEVETDTLIDAFKIQQAIIETFYKTQVFSVSFKGFRVPCQGGFSEDLGIEKTFEFTYQDDNKIKFKFSIEVETYYPVVDPTTTRLNSNRMTEIGPQPSEAKNELGPSTAVHTNGQPSKLILNTSINSSSPGIGFKIYPTKEKNNPPYGIEFTSPKNSDTFFSSGSLPLTWNTSGIVNLVNIYYKIEGTDEWRPIIVHLKNSGFYEWVIPFFEEKAVVESDFLSSKVISSSGLEARIRSIIDAGGGVEKIIIFNGGVSYNNDDLIQVNSVPKPFDKPMVFTPPLIQANVDESGSLIGATIIEMGGGFKESKITSVLIKIEDALNSSVTSTLSKQGVFTGDIDSSSLTENFFITNLSPTAAELIEKGYAFVGSRVFGFGVSEDAIIEEINTVNNYIKLNQEVIDSRQGEKFSLSRVDAVLKIR